MYIPLCVFLLKLASQPTLKRASFVDGSWYALQVKILQAANKTRGFLWLPPPCFGGLVSSRLNKNQGVNELNSLPWTGRKRRTEQPCSLWGQPPFKIARHHLQSVNFGKFKLETAKTSVPLHRAAIHDDGPRIFPQARAFVIALLLWPKVQIPAILPPEALIHDVAT